MAWLFGKKEKKEPEELPELPELPPLPRLEENITKKPNLPSLPSFPSSPIGEKMTSEAVKHAISEPEEPEMPMPRIGGPYKKMTREITEREMFNLPFQKPAFKPLVREIRPSIKTEPIFIRIDKYQAATAEFQEIKRKMLEIENLLREIKEIKSREDAELEQWEKEIQSAKEKLDFIDKMIFQKLEE